MNSSQPPLQNTPYIARLGSGQIFDSLGFLPWRLHAKLQKVLFGRGAQALEESGRAGPLGFSQGESFFCFAEFVCFWGFWRFFCCLFFIVFWNANQKGWFDCFGFCFWVLGIREKERGGDSAFGCFWYVWKFIFSVFSFEAFLRFLNPHCQIFMLGSWWFFHRRH